MATQKLTCQRVFVISNLVDIALDNDLSAVDASTWTNFDNMVGGSNGFLIMFDDNYRVANGRALRNTQLGNLLACCALTLPVACDVSPAGLMIMAPAGDDNRLLRVGEAIERTIAFHKEDSNK